MAKRGQRGGEDVLTCSQCDRRRPAKSHRDRETRIETWVWEAPTLPKPASSPFSGQVCQERRADGNSTKLLRQREPRQREKRH